MHISIIPALIIKRINRDNNVRSLKNVKICKNFKKSQKVWYKFSHHLSLNENVKMCFLIWYNVQLKIWIYISKLLRCMPRNNP